MSIKNDKFVLNVSGNGTVKQLILRDDPHKMNWVLTEDYLKKADFFSTNKLFGQFNFVIEDKIYDSSSVQPIIKQMGKKYRVIYDFHSYIVEIIYDLESLSELVWTIRVTNSRKISVKLQSFGIWCSFNYAMYRDTNVLKNVFHSAAIFPTISIDYTKLAVMRRTTDVASLGMYQLKGRTNSLGSYCDFSNKFLEDASPSLDGVIFHQLVLSGNHSGEQDWIYSKDQVVLQAEETTEWKYVIKEVTNQEDFYKKGMAIGHPKIHAPKMVKINQPFEISIENGIVQFIEAVYKKDDVLVQTSLNKLDTNTYGIVFKTAGEHKIIIHFEDGTSDLIVINVMDDLKTLVRERVNYLCETAYNHEIKAFLPLSNQGESVGKMSLILKKNLIDTVDKDQLLRVEESANLYVKQKWFEDGMLGQPKKVYGDFYRVMDFEYIGHLFFLLSQFTEDQLTMQKPDTYLLWASQVVDLRINPELHVDMREKEESEMLGVFFLYINELLTALEEKKIGEYEKLAKLWENNLFKILEEKSTLSAAMTEHYFDNAGFGPAAASLSNAGYLEECKSYGSLVLANIGFSNDFRAQNPDRWWEALSYMIHSLWGGITAAASLDLFLALKDPQYLEASYRAFTGVLYCYDTAATAVKSISKGEAVSSYAVASPHYNRIDLSKERFGQETFAKDGGLFARIFSEEPNQTSDWDMGEELVAYLERFGQSAYCYYDNDNELHGVNCSIKFEDNKVKIMSMAPYPKHIYLLKEGELSQLDGNGHVAYISIT
ncbi:hypothetical protein BAU15_11370 [Enterococcus sp. JM4C]|uniref:hypothetical protein n=1 Tax=Candidatus Enterococcus huntleyi TaxID=1857217 RepID=UPI0013798FB1|nr:hypothetical protein [Enterococcus sp. JM4C]KAF1297342.1 hypothetical protein BAU15_11370 [Enterococcus sp. JM4C]